MKIISRLLLMLIILVVILQIVPSQNRFKKEKLLFPEKKELIKSLKIKSKSLFVYTYINNVLIAPERKNLFESCLYDTNGNISEDYYHGFDGKSYKVNYTFNENGPLGRKVQSILDGDTTLITDYYYDNDNNLIKESSLASFDGKKRVTFYGYNADNLMIMKTTDDESAIRYRYEYDSFGNLVNTVEDNGSAKFHIYSRILTYNPDSMVVECRNYSDKMLQSTFNYVYDKFNNLIEENIHWEDMYNDRKSIYRYNENGDIVISKNFDGTNMIFNSRYKYNTEGLLIEKINLDASDKEVSVYKYVYENY